MGATIVFHLGKNGSRPTFRDTIAKPTPRARGSRLACHPEATKAAPYGCDRLYYAALKRTPMERAARRAAFAKRSPKFQYKLTLLACYNCGNNIVD